MTPAGSSLASQARARPAHTSTSSSTSAMTCATASRSPARLPRSRCSLRPMARRSSAGGARTRHLGRPELRDVGPLAVGRDARQGNQLAPKAEGHGRASAVRQVRLDDEARVSGPGCRDSGERGALEQAIDGHPLGYGILRARSHVPDGLVMGVRPERKPIGGGNEAVDTQGALHPQHDGLWRVRGRERVHRELGRTTDGLETG